MAVTPSRVEIGQLCLTGHTGHTHWRGQKWSHDETTVSKNKNEAIIRSSLTRSVVIQKTRNVRIMQQWSGSCNHCCSGEGTSVTCCECMCVFVALGIQHAMCIHLIISSSVACPALQHFSTLSHKGHNLKKKLLDINCVFWFPLQLLSETFLVLRRLKRYMIKNVYWSSDKAPVTFLRI